MKNYALRILPDNIVVELEEGADLLRGCYKAGIALDSPCGGDGTCGKCRVLLDGKLVKACKTYIYEDTVIEIPKASRIDGQAVLLGETKKSAKAIEVELEVVSPMAKKVKLTLEKPNELDTVSDLDRVMMALDKLGVKARPGLGAIRTMPEALRNNGFEISAVLVYYGDSETPVLADVIPCADKIYGFAIDVGTTTVVVQLVDLESGKIVDKAGAYNKQSVYGSDVISRIIWSEENKEGLYQLRQAVLTTINELIAQIIKRTGVGSNRVYGAVIAGNTVMEHLLLGVSAKHLRLEPYVPAAVSFPVLAAEQIGIDMAPSGLIALVPNVASYVGGDITAGVIVSTLLDSSEDITLFIDIGTNGELVLGNSEWMMTCACSAGPAFEGSGIACGMRAMDGAIDGLKIDKETFAPSITTINRKSPLGICGSGLIYALSAMLDAGVIDRVGNINPAIQGRYVREEEGELLYVLAYKRQYGNDKEIHITSSDIKNLLRAKAAIFAGIRVMLSNADLPIEAISRVVIAGGFGSCIDVEEAINIGLLPDVDPALYSYVGNSSVQGAMKLLLDRSMLVKSKEVAEAMTYLELSVGNQFMDEFVSAMFIPHTDMSLFPSHK